jgi:hypothetical protein
MQDPWGGILLVNRNEGQRGVIFCENCKQCFLGCPGELPADGAQERGAFETSEESTKVGTMVDLLNLAMLVCASVGSMAFGILAAYGILRVGFALMRPQARRTALKARAEVARVS